jgi:SAM-dependent methyltransferase
MYDTFSSDYDRFVNWPSRLALELPFLEKQIAPLARRARPPRVLDAACGTGMHAIALAQRGYILAGADLSSPMIDRARANAATAGVSIQWEALGFGALAAAFGSAGFDALLCLGNSLPHVLDTASLADALADFAACLRPGGLLLVQNRNFDAVLSSRQRWMEPQSHREGDREWIFQRFYDFDPDGLITFHVVTLQREGPNPWRQQIASTRLRPLRQADLTAGLMTAGFESIQFFGSLSGDAFQPQTSGNLVLVAQRPA